MTETKALTTGGESGALMVANLETQVNTIQLAMKSLMKDGVHYGKIPGCGNKPALLKPGAEKLTFMFKLAPKFEKEVDDLGGGHREVTIITKIYDNQGNFLGEGLGSCSTMESKYRWRNAGKPCPACGFEGSILRSPAKNGGGYWCNAKKGGCGQNFKSGTASCKKLDLFKAGKVENPDIADQYNTVLKMAKKRSLVDATLTVTAASDVFEQDLDDFSEAELEEIRATKKEERGKPRTEPPAAKKKEPAKNAKSDDPPPPAAKSEEGNATFSLDDYKNMSNENKENLPEWWAGIRDQAKSDLGVAKYSLLEQYLIGFHGMEIEGGVE